MKKLLIFLVAFWVFGYTYAQQESAPLYFIGSGASDLETNGQKYQLQVGGSIVYGTNGQYSVMFPYNVLYTKATFSEENFSVSKGYYGDKVSLNWIVEANQDKVKRFVVYRKLLSEPDSEYKQIKTLASDTYSYDDKYVQAGILYSYKVVAEGVSVFNKFYITYIEGVGFRSPTATITGKISFKGGTPVKDVVVQAQSESGGSSDANKSFNANGKGLTVNKVYGFSNANAVTFQTWIKASNGVATSELFGFNKNKAGTAYDARATFKMTNDTFEVEVFRNGTSIGKKTVSKAFPTGKIDAFNKDILTRTQGFSGFVHISIVLEDNEHFKLYINGREMNQSYVNNTDAYVYEAGVPSGDKIKVTEQNSANFSAIAKVNNISICNHNAAGSSGTYIDEVRIWGRALSSETIKTDFRRYISGGESGLKAYFRFDEGYGNRCYDVSKVDFEFNKNDAVIIDRNKNVLPITGSQAYFSNATTDVPNVNQLGVFGVTDANGNYIISAIPYKGDREPYKIAPTLGVHKFSPAVKPVILGKGKEIVNEMNFEDVSSFAFLGQVLYDVRGVFDSSRVEQDNINQIKEHGYNQYKVTKAGSTEYYDKGQYYYEGGTKDASGYLTGGKLYKYVKIGLEDANIFIDGDMVIDENNQPIKTKSDGSFTIRVPIGKHRIEVQKQGHTFTYNGRFPADKTKLFEFYQDQTKTVNFVDNTRITAVGRVVGGHIQYKKPIGFGYNGKYEHIINEGTPNEKTQTVSSKNNIGVAHITLQAGTDADKSLTIKTNVETGEYKINLIPYLYKVKRIEIPSNKGNDGIRFNTSFSDLDFRKVEEPKEEEFITDDNKTLKSVKFHYHKSFKYLAPSTLEVISQGYEKKFKLKGELYDFSDLAIPLYKQRKEYKIAFQVYQNYQNKDARDPNYILEDKIFLNSPRNGRFAITNNIAINKIPKADAIVLASDKKTWVYKFKAGNPNFTPAEGYAQSLSVQYVPTGKSAIEPTVGLYKDKGIVLGFKDKGAKIFATNAPEVPDLVLRDPPGSNSFASIERGSVFTFTRDYSNTDEDSDTYGYNISLGADIEISTGIGVETTTSINVTADTEGNFEKRVAKTSATSSEHSYSFSKTISTSDDPDYVGADGDLYIGNSKNTFYTEVDDLRLLNKNKSGALILSGVKDKEGNPLSNNLYLYQGNNMLVMEQITPTFFMYSQKHIVEVLIPEFEKLRDQLRANPPAPTQTSNPRVINEPKNAVFYQKQIDSWKRIIAKNEEVKFKATSTAGKKELKKATEKAVDVIYKEELKVFEDKLKELEKEYKKIRDKEITGGDIVRLVKYIHKQVEISKIKVKVEEQRRKVNVIKAEINKVKDLFKKNFTENRSFDAGLGEFTSSIQTTRITSTQHENSIDVNQQFASSFGVEVNGIGVGYQDDHQRNKNNADGSNNSEEKYTNISYTLKDNDKGNFFSIDIVNSFDGSGPVFVTKGGASSCPHEVATKSQFYKKNDKFVTLSEGTVPVNVPDLKVDKNVLTNIPESSDAIFNLTLKNLSSTKTDGEYLLQVDQTTLGGAKTNIAQNGVKVFLEYNKPVKYPIHISKLESSDKYKYENIKVYLEDGCGDDGMGDTSVTLSVTFKKSCTKVNITTPKTNWVFNRDESKRIGGKLPITFTDFNSSFSGFNRIDLEYRNSNASDWQKFQSYYASETAKTEAGDEQGIVIDSSQSDYTFNWNIVGKEVPDGTYEIRAVSYCVDDIKSYSEVIKGTVNLKPPVPFGTPSPEDGILDIGEDLTVTFNETVKKGSLTDIVIKGLSNQQKIDHKVSVQLDGSDKHIVMQHPSIPNGSFTIQCWLDNTTRGNGYLFKQDENGISAKIEGSKLLFKVNDETLTTSIANDAGFNFYSFVYKKGTKTSSPMLYVYKNGTKQEDKTLQKNLTPQNDTSLYFGDTNVTGYIHDIRIWAKAFTAFDANTAKDQRLTGSEKDLLGAWSLDEGRGTKGADIARNRHAKVQLGWSIKPKGTSLQFKNNAYTELDDVTSVQLTKEKDATLSFWIKTTQTNGTIFSNGRGNTDDALISGNQRGKWSVNLVNGQLVFSSEGNNYVLTTTNVNDGTWKHIAITIKRGGTINSYINGEQISSVSSEKIGGFFGDKIWIGARGYQPTGLPEVIDQQFVGAIDELRLWNGVRSFNQIKRDAYYEIEPNEIGLLLYARMNKSDDASIPQYHRLTPSGFIKATGMKVQGVVSYAEDSPPIKPKRLVDKILYDLVINKDKILIKPRLTTKKWYLYENQILDITVEKMYDEYNNKQVSPLNWTAYVNRQEIEWFTKERKKEINVEKKVNQPYQFKIDVVNKGGKNQPYTLSGLPSWLKTSKTTGSLAPNSSEEILFVVDKELAMGTYEKNVYLNASNNYTDKLSVKLRVVKEAPDWSVNKTEYAYSMNIIGNIVIDAKLVRDTYTKVGAFVDGKPRGEAYLQYDKKTDTYLVYLSVYSNKSTGENISFKVWNAEEGKVSETYLDNQQTIVFIQNEVRGTKSVPAKFTTNNVVEQELNLNKGWTWITPYVKDEKMKNLNKLFDNKSYEGDYLKSRTVQQSANYTDGKWKGNLTEITNGIAYKVKMNAKPRIITLKGALTDIKATNTLVKGWNMLAFPIYRNVSIQDALAYYSPTDGDVIKGQFNFAIYDENSSSWNGNLEYLKAGEGYMIKTKEAQSFVYANNFSNRQARASQSTNPNRALWTQYAENMNLVVEVLSNDTDFNKIQVLDTKGNLRGESSIIKDKKGRKLSYLTVFSNTPDEKLHIKVIRKGTMLPANFDVNFTSNLVQGTFAKPYQLQLQTKSLDTTELTGLVLYPNPTTDVLNVNVLGTNSTKLELKLYATSGAMLINKKINRKENGNVITIKIKALPAGVYILNVVDEFGKQTNRKIIKK